MNNIIEDVSKITTIPTWVLHKLIKRGEACISHSILENLESNENMTSVDIGIGTLNIMVNDDEIKYKFIPSDELETIVKNTVTTHSSDLIVQLETTLKERIMNTYKELL